MLKDEPGRVNAGVVKAEVSNCDRTLARGDENSDFEHGTDWEIRIDEEFGMYLDRLPNR